MKKLEETREEIRGSRALVENITSIKDLSLKVKMLLPEDKKES